MSPALGPLTLSGRPAQCTTDCTKTPSVTPFAFNRLWPCSLSDCVNWIPIDPRVTLPFLMIWLYTFAPVLMGQRDSRCCLVSARTRSYGGVDADYFTAHIEQRASAVSGVDGSIGLEEVLELAIRLPHFRR